MATAESTAERIVAWVEKYAGNPVREDGAAKPDQRSEEREQAAAK